MYSGPVVDDEKQIEYNARNIVINDYLGFSISSDTGNYMRLANDPSLLFENERYVKGRKLTAGNVGLSRPGSFITVYLISKPIEKIYLGKVDGVSSRINAETRSILTRVKIDNSNFDIIPEHYLR